MPYSHKFEIQASVTGGVKVLHWQQDVPKDTPGWIASENEARRKAARQMCELANDLMRQADYLTRDRRGE